LDRLRADPALAGQELTTALISGRLLDPQTLWTHLVQRAQTLLLAGVMSHGGTFHFDPDAPRVPQAFPMGDRWGLPTALVRMVPNVALRHRLEPVWNRPVMKSGGSVDVVDLKLTPQETRALSRFDGVASLSQLAAAHPTEAEALMRLAYLLRHLEAVSFLAPLPQAEASGPPPASGAAPPPATVRTPAQGATSHVAAPAPGAPGSAGGSATPAPAPATSAGARGPGQAARTPTQVPPAAG